MWNGCGSGARPIPDIGGVLTGGRGEVRYRYSVAATYASTRLTLKRTPDHLWLYHEGCLVAEHIRRYDQGQDYLQPDHEKPLLLERRSLREQRLLQHFLQLSPKHENNP
jgi:hypothetical protein